MLNHDLKKRTRLFALRIIRLCESLPKGRIYDTIANQLVRCGTSVGSNYRASCRARSKADFISKMGIVEEECDESIYWMEILIEAGIVEEMKIKDLLEEANELLSIIVSSIKTARSRK